MLPSMTASSHRKKVATSLSPSASNVVAVFTDNFVKLSPQLSTGISKTSALKVTPQVSVGHGIGLGISREEYSIEWRRHQPPQPAFTTRPQARRFTMTDLTTMPENYENIRTGIVELLKAARSAAARNVNSIMTATYWEIGRRVVLLEQGGEQRAGYGDQLIDQLARDLTRQFGRGYSQTNLKQMRSFYIAWPVPSDSSDAV